MFIYNKYHLIYNQLIDKAKNRNFSSKKEAKKKFDYVELHHILPKSLGGNNDSVNTVFLTAREHFIAHLLLVRFTIGEAKQKMVFAINKMTNISDNQIRHLPKSYQYEFIRKNFSKHISEFKTGKIGTPKTEAQKLEASKKSKGIPKSPTTIQNMIASWDNMERKLDLKARNKKNQILNNMWKNDEFRNRMVKSASIRQKSRLSDPTILNKAVSNLNTKMVCVCCGVTTNAGNYYRWHGDNCKHREN